MGPPEPEPPIADAQGTTAVLAEVLREAEAVLDRQLQGIEQADGKFERLVALAATALGGMVAIAFFSVRNFPTLLDPWLVGLFLAGALLDLVSIGLFLVGYAGVKHHVDIVIGPGMAWLEEKSQDPSWGLEDHLLALVPAYRSFVEANTRTMERKAAWRARGAYLLGAAVLLVTMSIAGLLGSSLTG